ncbi:MAG TPA: hypothetical protein VF203_14260 [Burkholderiales bacterium]
MLDGECMHGAAWSLLKTLASQNMDSVSPDANDPRDRIARSTTSSGTIADTEYRNGARRERAGLIAFVGR